MKRVTTCFASFLFAMISFGSANAFEVTIPETIIIDAGRFMYRASGEYLKMSYPVDAPLQNISFSQPLEIMKYQVRVEDYEKCVQESHCGQKHKQGTDFPGQPVTGVSYQNAVDFAKWLSDKTGVHWRLPTDKEWAFAAGSRFVDDAVNARTDSENPAERWLAKYKKYAELETKSDPLIKPSGAYGSNENGIYDLSGNIWEWTESCYTRIGLDANDNETSRNNNCGVRIAAGQHRAYISDFIQDAKGGGCSIGAPPTYLGIRLVKMQRQGVFVRFLNFIGIGGSR